MTLTPDTLRLGDVATLRSGDKGNHANLAAVAATQEVYDFLLETLTAERVHTFFSDWQVTRVERFCLPNVWALNFVLYNALAGGASQSLRIDTQGKLLGAAAQEILLPVGAEQQQGMLASARRSSLPPSAAHTDQEPA